METRDAQFNSKIIIGLKTGLLVIFIGLFMNSCGTNRNSENTSEELTQLYDRLNEKGFEIDNSWAIPLGGNMISLVGNPNFIRFENDSVGIFLPYFGERYSGGSYGEPGGIEYEGPARNLSIEEKRNNKVVVKFNGKQGSELLDFIVTIFPDGSANTSVNSSERATISYRGNVDELPQENVD